MLALDGSSYAEAANGYACEIAARHNCTITGVAIIDKPGIQSTGGPVSLGGAHYEVVREEHLLKETREKTKAILDEFTQTCKNRNINSLQHADTGSPFSENEIDLLLMGAYGRKSVREFFVGSVTQHLIQDTDIPLFLYH